jgi:hypothetical protein
LASSRWPFNESDFDRRAAVGTALFGEGADDVHTVLGEQGDTVALVVDDRPGQQTAEHLCGRLEGFTQQPVPRAAGVAAEAVLEQQHEVVVVAAEHAVVEGLPVVGVGASLQQQPGKGAGVRMPGLAVFSIAEYAGEHGKGSGQGMPETAIVGVRASVEEQPGRLQRDPQVNVGVVAGVGLV